MDRLKASLGSIAFLVVAPGTVAGLIPWWITHWRASVVPRWWLGVTALAWSLIVVGILALLAEFARFAVQGIGTPAPLAPTQHLVTRGLYRWVRNPMYVAVVTVVVGESLLFASWGLLVYAVLAAATMALFVRGYEQPTLLARYGAEYTEYCDRVRAWMPGRPAPEVLQFSDEVLIDASVGRVWELTIDIERWPLFAPTMQSIQRLDGGPLRVGSRVRIKQPGQRPAVWTVNRLEPEHTFAWQSLRPGLTIIATHRLQPMGPACRNTLMLEVSGPAVGLVALVLGKRMLGALRAENAGLKAFAERPRPGR